MRRLIPAEPLETAVRTVLQEVLVNCEQVHNVVRAIAERELRTRRSPGSDLAELQREKASLEQKIAFVIEELDSIGREAAKAKSPPAPAADCGRLRRRSSGALTAVRNSTTPMPSQMRSAASSRPRRAVSMSCHRRRCGTCYRYSFQRWWSIGNHGSWRSCLPCRTGRRWTPSGCASLPILHTRRPTRHTPFMCWRSTVGFGREGRGLTGRGRSGHAGTLLNSIHRANQRPE